ncbi:alpha/beta hydrolase [Streptomyces sp. KR80]|uniref:alpha/beta hydrolase n=1 Tax=Streptomyces sp. KR80 TaxID=3457426 RepID=UPI003FD45ED3
MTVPAAAESAGDVEVAAVLAHAPVPADATFAYGEHPDQVVDFYAPCGGEGTAPLVVLLHGGAWRAPYDRRHISPLAAHLARHGFAVASVEYRRGPAPSAQRHGGPALSRAGRWPDTLDDVATAVDVIPTFVKELTAESAESAESAGAGSAATARGRAAAPWVRVDAGRVVLVGHSAGGHLALWAAARHRQPGGSPWRLAAPPPVRGVVALAPIADFALGRELGVCSDAVVQFLGGPEAYAARRPYADPAALLPTGIATTIVQGATDSDVPPQVARAFADAAERAGARTRLVVLDGVGHFPLIDPTAPATRTVVAEIERLSR